MPRRHRRLLTVSAGSGRLGQVAGLHAIGLRGPGEEGVGGDRPHAEAELGGGEEADGRSKRSLSSSSRRSRASFSSKCAFHS